MQSTNNKEEISAKELYNLLKARNNKKKQEAAAAAEISKKKEEKIKDRDYYFDDPNVFKNL